MVGQTSSPPESRLFLLGTPHAEVGGQALAIAHRKPLALLAYLAVTQRIQSREVLAALLWPEHETSRAYAYLRNALWQLGQTALAGWIFLEQDAVSLADGVWVDACEFERTLNTVRAHTHPPEALCADCVAHLSDAVAIYQGDFMAGFGLPDSPDFEEWQFFQTEHLRQAIAGALERLTRYHGARGNIELALASARRWSALDPLNEPAQRALMTLYAKAGQRAAAVHQYDALLRNLRSSRLEPAPETVNTYKRIRAGEIEDVTSCVASDVLVAPAAHSPRHNLPVQATAFVGREAELAEIYELLTLPECRLVTLTGPGGIGKTRLALQAAQEQMRGFPDGVVCVRLAAVSDLDSLVAAIVEALGTSLYPQSNLSSSEQLLIYLEARKILLVLDNFEHLLDHSALVVDMLARAPSIKLLITSRERLNVRGEWVVDISGLDRVARDSEKPATSDAVALFLDTAQRIAPSFAPDEGELRAIVRLCDLVEGMPLGIELAAAWTKMLSCSEIADEIETSLDFLTVTLRDLPERHQSLRAVFARSWGLLSVEERRYFRALSVFRSGCTREAAQAVAGARLPTLVALMDKSLVYRRVEESPGAGPAGDSRYGVLEVLRQYAEEQLQAAPGEAEAVRTRHAAYYLGLVHRVEALMKAPARAAPPLEQRLALDILQAEFDNIRWAWEWAISAGMIDDIAHATLGLALFFEMRSRFREGEALFQKAADTLLGHADAKQPALLAMLRAIQGEFLCRFGHVTEGCAIMEQVRPLLASAPDPAGLALLNVVSSYIGVGLNIETRRQRLEESLHLYGALDDSWGVALAQEALGEFLASIGGLEEGERLLIESLSYRRSVGDDWGAAMSLHALAGVSAAQGRGVEVVDRLRESIALREQVGDIRGVANANLFLAQWMMHRGDTTAALAFHTQSLRGHQEIGDLNSVAGILTMMGNIHEDLGNLRQAHAHWLSALEHRRLLRQDPERAAVLHRLGRAEMGLRALSKARDHLSESLAAFEKLGDTANAAAVRHDLDRLRELQDAA